MGINLKVAGTADVNDAAALAKAAAKLAIAGTDTSVVSNLTSLAFVVGKASMANSPPDFTPPFNAWRDVHYSGDRKLPTPGSQKVMVSAYSSVVALGFHKAYDATPIADFLLDKSDGKLKDWSKRGKWCREILVAFPDKCPTDVEMTAALPEKATKTAHDTAQSIMRAAEKAFGVKGDFIVACTTPAQKLAALDLVAAAKAFATAMPEDDDGVDYTAEAAKLRAEMAAKN